MKTKMLAMILCYASYFMMAQTGGGEFQFKSTECLSNDERVSVQKMLKTNKQTLQLEGKLTAKSSLPSSLFIWPIKKSATAPYNEVWSISNYVDHNPNYPNQLLDYNCGNRTYDTNSGYNHAGIDIFTWPFGWYQMDHNQAEVIAAAPGIIIGKSNGNYDRNCNFNNSNWNAVYVQHDDGSVAWYGHLKNNSLTTKNIGQAVAAGEYLGIVGSSGNSTGPHLHFEVYNSSNQLVDPYHGSCNSSSSGAQSWWQVQKNYNNPKINAISTHSQEVSFNNGCGVQESTYFKNSFNSGETVFIYTYLSDIAIGTPVNIQLIRPDQTIAYTTSFNMNAFYSASYWFWSLPASTFNQDGNWKAKVTVGSMTETHHFTYGTLSVSDYHLNNFIIKVLNPVKNHQIQLEYNGKLNQKFTVEIYSMAGRLVNKRKIILQKGNNILPFNATKGSYLMKISSENFEETFKILN